MQIVYTTDGFDIEDNGRILLRVPSNPAGTAWTTAEKEAYATEMFNQMLETNYKEPARKAVADDFVKELSAISKPYPAEEKLSWDKQEAEARAYLADNTTATPFLDAMIAVTGEVKADIAAAIVAKADGYAAAVAAAVGKKRMLIGQIDAATTSADVEAVKWNPDATI